MGICSNGSAFGANYFSRDLVQDEFTSLLVPLANSTGALFGKMAGHTYSHREIGWENMKKDLVKIPQIILPYQAFNYTTNFLVLSFGQNFEWIDSSSNSQMVLTNLGVNLFCSLLRYKTEDKVGILK